jgi:hypothetical protein
MPPELWNRNETRPILTDKSTRRSPVGRRAIPSVGGETRPSPKKETPMMSMGSDMMMGMGVVGVLVIIALVLAIAALIKYLMSRRS